MNRKVVEFDVKGWIENSRVVGQDGQELPHNWDIRGRDCSEHVPILTARSTTFLARATPPVGALKKPPGATWVHLVANGPPISISTWCILSVRHPRWILGRLAVLTAEKEVSPGQVEAFAPIAIALPNLV